MKKIKIFLILCLLLSLYIFICAFSYVSAISNNLYNSIFRLHVIANSDSEEDQNLKYVVRDNLINFMNEKSSQFSTKEEVTEYAKNNIDEFKKIAEETIAKEGFNFNVILLYL